MNKHIKLIFFSITSLLLIACGEDQNSSNTKTIENPVNTYMDSRINAMDMAKKSVKESNKRVNEQNKAMETLSK